MLESVDLVKAGKAPRIKQDGSQATYEGRCTADNARIDWGKPWRQVHNLIRGCNPAPGAWTSLNGQTLQIFESKPLPEIVPPKTTVSERLIAKVALLLTSPTIEPVVPPLPSCSVPAEMTVPPE